MPMIVGAIPFGILFGATAIHAGLSVTATLALSLIVFAGSAQFVAAGLVATGAAIPVIILTTFFVNLRHALYSVSLVPYLKTLPQLWLVPLSFWLTDETYATVISRYRASERETDCAEHQHWFQLGSSVAMYVNWQLCTFIGVVAGSRLDELSSWGLDFAFVVTFIGIVVPLIHRWPMLVCAVVAGIAALVFRDVPHQLGLLLAAVTGIASGIASEHIGSRSPSTDGSSA